MEISEKKRKKFLFSNEVRNWLCFLLIGTINNTPYCVVTSAAKGLSSFFAMEEYFGVILFANVSMGVVTGIINAFFLQKVSHLTRVIMACISWTFGLIGVAFSTTIFGFGNHAGFWFCVGSILFISAATNFGESLIVGYMKNFGDSSLSGFGTGTGCAGIAGALVNLIFQSFNLPFYFRFLFFIPWIWCYLLIFAYGIKEPTKEEIEKRKMNEIKNRMKGKTLEEKKLLETELFYKNEKKKGIIGEILRFLRVIKYCWFYSANLFLVYWFEYVISTCFAEKLFVADPENPSSVWALQSNYEILQFCYQFGVLISRSSIKLIKIRQVWIMTVIQFFFIPLWFVFAYFKIITTPILIWISFPLMIFVGLLGGASYVNCYYCVLNHKDLSEKDREYASNLTTITNTTGIMMSSISTIVLDSTILKTKRFDT